MSELSIRRYRSQDHDAVWDLHNFALNQVGAHGGNGPFDDDLHQIETVYFDRGEFLVGELDGRIVAMGALRRSDDARAEIKRMRVHPDWQGRGYGRAILNALESRVIARGYQSLHLDTTTIQTVAQALYRSAGYVETGRGRYGPFELIFFEKGIGGEGQGYTVDT
jgi:ribosomal protein S18 acetylase RimI-like enzyme